MKVQSNMNYGLRAPQMDMIKITNTCLMSMLMLSVEGTLNFSRSRDIKQIRD
jgi:hypothetical protein